MNATKNPGQLPFITTDEDIARIKKEMRSYRAFATPAEMVAELNRVARATENFLGLQVFAQGIEFDPEAGEKDKDGNAPGEYVLIDETKYADSTPILAFVGGQNKDAKSGKSTPIIKGIQAFGIPTVESAMASAPDLIAKILSKEMRHVYFRNFRDVGTIAAAQAGFEAAPVGIEAFAASHARSAAEELDTDTFDAVWPAIRKSIVESRPALAKLLPPKGEILKAIRSKSYAEGMYPDLEAKNIFIGLAASVVQVAAAQDKPLDSTAIKGWFADRANVNIEFRKATAEDIAKLDAFDPAQAAAALGIAPSA